MKKIKNFIAALLCLAMFSGTVLTAFAEDEIIEEENELLEEEETSEEIDYEELYKEHQEELGLSTNTNSTIKLGTIHTDEILDAYMDQQRVFPKYDTTGMTDLEILLENMILYYSSTITDEEAVRTVRDEALPHYAGGGRFNDEGLDYDSLRGKVGLSLSRTARYMRCLAKAYYIEDCEYYQSPEIKEIFLECCRDFVRRFDGVFSWQNETKNEFWGYTVAPFTTTMPAVITFYHDIPKDLLNQLIGCMLWMPEEIVDTWNTGTNAVWYAEQAVVRGALEQNEYWVNVGINRLDELTQLNRINMIDAGVATASLEGFQPDGTYHMHGATLYLSYALSSLQDVTLFASLFNDTKYTMNGMNNALDFAMNGALWSARGEYMEPQGYGRLIGSQTSLNTTDILRKALCRLAFIYPDKYDEIKLAIRHTLSEKDGMFLPLNGTLYFPRSEVLAHHRDGYSLWIRTTSKRVAGMEFNGKISIDAYWGHTGVTGIYDGKEHNLMVTNPFFDYAFYPGVTNPRHVYINKNSSISDGIHQVYSGGVSDGDFGSTSFKMTERMGSSAYKSYYMFDEGYVALGTGIRSSNWAEVNTTVEQRYLKGDVQINGQNIAKGEKTYKDVNTVYHSGTGYIFPEEETIGIKNKTVIASWTDRKRDYNIDQSKLKAEMFTLWINHGLRPSNGDYVYQVLMNTTPEKLEEYNKNNPIVIAANNKKQQAVWHKTANIAYATFYEGGEVRLHENLSVKADVPCLVMIREENGKLKVCVSNPYSHKADVKITVTTDGKANEMTFNLPGLDETTANYGGSTVTQIIG